jgi:predicted RNA polymerase sigma factor
VLDQLTPGPVVTLNRAVAVAMSRGPQAGLDLLASLDGDPRMARYHRLAAVRAHLLELDGQTGAARASYERAAALATSDPERRYLRSRAARLSATEPG